MTTDEFFAEAKRLGLRMHLGPEDQKAAFDAKDAENERLREALQRIANFGLSQFMGPHDMALECVNLAAKALRGPNVL